LPAFSAFYAASLSMKTATFVLNESWDETGMRVNDHAMDRSEAIIAGPE